MRGCRPGRPGGPDVQVNVEKGRVASRPVLD